MATDYPYTAQTLDIMLRLTRITSPTMRRALHDHFVLQDKQAAVAERYGYTKQHFGVHVRHIRTKIKPAFDEYARAVLE